MRGRIDHFLQARQRVGEVAFLRCLLYTSDAADDLLCVDLGGRRIIKKKKQSTFMIDLTEYINNVSTLDECQQVEIVDTLTELICE